MTDILTVTMNPAVDVSTSTGQVVATHKLRCDSAQREPGGGGINVARVVQRLGGSCAALYAAGGAPGLLLGQLLDAEQVSSLRVDIAGETRENFTVRDRSAHLEYRFVLPGPELSAPEWQACLDRIAAPAIEPRYLVASGSLPPGVPADFYARCARLARERGLHFILDTSGPALAAALDEGVYLVKPSLRELRELSGKPLTSESQWRGAAQQLVDEGRAAVVVLSLGEGGALLVTADGVSFSPALPVQVTSSVGAGDSFVGGMVTALARNRALDDAFAYGVAAASAALLTSGTGLCRAEDVERLYRQVVVKK